MGSVKFPYVRQYTDNRGCERTYFRYKGKNYPLPAPTEPEFSAEYDRLSRTVAGKVPVKVGAEVSTASIQHLVRLYQASPEFAKLGERTKADYTALLSPIVRDHGAKSYKRLTPGAVTTYIRDPLAATPRRADMTVATLSAVYKWAIDRELVKDNPCLRVGKLYTAGEGYRAWTAAEVETFAANCTDFEWLVFVLGLYTSQRPGDLVKLTWFQYDGERFTLRQSKTKVPLVIHAHPVLRETLAGLRRTEGTILAKRDGAPLRSDELSKRWRLTMRRMKLTCTLYGLRTTSAALLAEAGASSKLIASRTGHRTLAMVDHYTRNAEQARLSEAGSALLPSVSRTPKKPVSG